MDIIPIMKREADGAIITQFDYPGCEALGLVKMDFLGLRNLTILDDALINVKLNRGIDIDLDELQQGHHRPGDLRAAGHRRHPRHLPAGRRRHAGAAEDRCNRTTSRTSPQPSRCTVPARWVRTATPTTRCARPARQPVDPIHPELAEPLADILDLTYGLIVYQEQVQQIAQRVAGYSLGRADELRRAMGKKKKEVLEKEFVPFQAGMRANGYSDSAIQTLWDILIPFSAYAFNKAHTAAYGLISYWTAYLKANYRGRVHGGPAAVGEGRQGQVGDLPRRVPPDGHQGAAAGRERVRGHVHADRRGHPLRPRRHPQRRRQRGARHRRGPHRARQGGRLQRVPRQRAAGGLQQAGDRVADQGRCVRLDGAHPARR